MKQVIDSFPVRSPKKHRSKITLPSPIVSPKEQCVDTPQDLSLTLEVKCTIKAEELKNLPQKLMELILKTL